MGGMHRVVKSLVALLAVVFIGLVALLDYEVLLLIRHQSSVEATVRAAFAKVDDVLQHMRDQVARLSDVERGLQEVRSRVSGLSDRYTTLQESQQSLLTRLDALVTRLEVAFNETQERQRDYAELLQAFQDSQQALLELRQEYDLMRDTLQPLETGAAPSNGKTRTSARSASSS